MGCLRPSRKSPRTRKAGAAFADRTRRAVTRSPSTRRSRRHSSGMTRPRTDSYFADRWLAALRAHVSGRKSKAIGSCRCDDVFNRDTLRWNCSTCSGGVRNTAATFILAKACFSTAAPLCHWPCSCYPLFARQTQDSMNGLSESVLAHGIMIVTPVNWYQVTSPFKLMIDRWFARRRQSRSDPNPRQGCVRGQSVGACRFGLSAASGGTFVCRRRAWRHRGHYRRWPRDFRFAHLHALEARRNRCGTRSLYRFWKPYATSHDDLDADTAFQEEIRIVARTLIAGITAQRSGQLVEAAPDLRSPREK